MTDKGFENVNSDAILEVRDLVIFESQRFDMGTWANVPKDYRLTEETEIIPVCNTVGCIAGSALILDGWKVMAEVADSGEHIMATLIKDDATMNVGELEWNIEFGSNFIIVTEAAKVLGIPIDEASIIFWADWLNNDQVVEILETWSKGKSALEIYSDFLDDHTAGDN